MKWTKFKHRVAELHRQANDERMDWGERPISFADYVKENKWWLRTIIRKEKDVDRKN